jgi:glycerol-3-phosphate acyltransferase PlsY
MIYEYIIISILSYLVGSAPFAFLLVKFFYNRDITLEGSKNSGAMNGYEVTNNKIIGFLIFILDFAKAFLLLYGLSHFTDDLLSIRLAAAFVVLGHNYSIFLGLKGGRGLSPAAGAISFLNPFGVIIWIIMYYTSKMVINKDVHISIAIGLIAANIMLWASPIEILIIFENYKLNEINDFRLLYILISIFIISKLANPIKESLNKETLNKESS